MLAARTGSTLQVITDVGRSVRLKMAENAANVCALAAAAYIPIIVAVCAGSPLLLLLYLTALLLSHNAADVMNARYGAGIIGVLGFACIFFHHITERWGIVVFVNDKIIAAYYAAGVVFSARNVSRIEALCNGDAVVARHTADVTAAAYSAGVIAGRNLALTLLIWKLE